MTENDKLAALILEFCRAMLINTREATSEDIVQDFLKFVRMHNLR